MQPATAMLLMCGASLARGELHHEHQTEVHIDALAKLAGCRLLAKSLDYTLESCSIFCPPGGPYPLSTLWRCVLAADVAKSSLDIMFKR